MVKAISSNLGYPRLGEKREWKKALERYWNGKSSQAELEAETKEIRLHALKKQQEKGIELIPVGDFSYYDHILDTSFTFGIIPKRFETDQPTLDTYFEVARGRENAVASEMTKWFNTNYHYIVPELKEVQPKLAINRPLKYYLEAKEELGIDGKPVVIGPITYLKLGKGLEGDFENTLNQFIPLYQQLIKELEEGGAKWIQIDEPYLATSFPQEELALYKKTYEAIRAAAPEIKIELQTYFESLDYYEEIVKLPVNAIGIDFIHDHGESLAALEKYGFPADKILAAGVIDGRNVWRSDLHEKEALLAKIAELAKAETIIVQPSNSLLHVPVTKATEPDLEEVLWNGLSFADEKLDEITALTKALSGEQVADFEASAKAVAALNASAHRNNSEVQTEIKNLEHVTVERALPFEQRIKQQHDWLQLPLLPTTTIGSFPQSPEVRKKRAEWLKGNLSDQDYDTYIKAEIKRWIDIQEDLDIDVLVHGEFERTDMVEYFGQKLAGFQATKFGWVQSYGSRAVRPPLIYGDVAFTEEITVKESVYAQSLTDRPVKGMLTAPVTIINWSFVRDDIPDSEVANQIGLALRQEVEALEANGIRVIQVDEPALREGLPLKESRWKKYLDDAVYSFKLTTTSVKNDTQIHTHMCYSDFDDIIDTISALDADVISIETSRSHGEIISTFEEVTYDKEIGLGVYDIHSPRVPSVEEIQDNIKRALRAIDVKQFWINPDCGLKTRKEPETIAALKDMVKATKAIRAEYQVTEK